MPAESPPSLLRMLWQASHDRLLVILMVSAAVSLVLTFAHPSSTSSAPDSVDRCEWAWLDGAAIMAAVVTIILCNGINDWQKERAFRELALLTNKRLVTVLEGTGQRKRIDATEVAVGDFIVLEAGETLAADAVCIAVEGMGTLAMDESTLTGESEAVPRSVGSLLPSESRVMEGASHSNLNA